MCQKNNTLNFENLNRFDFQNHNIINFTVADNKQILSVLKWRNNPEVRKWMYSENIIELDEHISFIESLKKDKKNFYWIVDDIGVIYLNKINLAHRNAYLGIYKNTESKNSANVLMVCLKYIAFDLLGLHTLKLEVIENNIKAIHFYEKNNFKIEGRLKEFILKENKWIDILIMGFIND